jgi:hypothetical protein
MTGERRDRMGEIFVAVHDALERAAVPTYGLAVTKLPDLPRPAYLPARPPQSVTEYLAALGKLSKLGIVKVH